MSYVNISYTDNHEIEESIDTRYANMTIIPLKDGRFARVSHGDDNGKAYPMEYQILVSFINNNPKFRAKFDTKFYNQIIQERDEESRLIDQRMQEAEEAKQDLISQAIEKAAKNNQKVIYRSLSIGCGNFANRYIYYTPTGERGVFATLVIHSGNPYWVEEGPQISINEIERMLAGFYQQ